jgi:hypothetical protein
LSHTPAGYWRFNESAGSPPLNKLANSGTLGSLGDGYAVIDPTQPLLKGQPGIVGNCVKLRNDGNTVAFCGSKVDVPFRQALNPPVFSVEFWANPSSLTTDSTGLSPLSSFNPNFNGGASRAGYLFYLNGTRWEFRMGLTSGYAVIVDAAGFVPQAGSWQHVVATYDGTTAKIYVNGVLRGSGAVNPAWKPNSQMALRLGGTPLTGSLSDAPYTDAASYSGNRGYDGLIDEVAVYPTALSASTVAAHFSAATTNNAGYDAQILASSPVGYWNLDEAAVTAPSPSAFPIAVNVGSVGAAGNATNWWGVLNGQPGPAYAGFGPGNNAAFLDGENGYIPTMDAPGLQHLTNTLTLMAWVKPGVRDFYRDIIARGWDTNFAETFLRISRNQGGTNFVAFGTGNYYQIGSSDGATFYDSADYPVPDGDIGNWVFLVGTYDGANWNLYRNGVLVATAPSNGDGIADVLEPWTIGSRSDQTDNAELFSVLTLGFGGSIDEPAILGSALSAPDIAALWNAALVPPVITTALQVQGPVFKGQSVPLNVWAEGNGTLNYLWTSNGVSIATGVTNITINNAQVGTETIAVIVSNSYGTNTNSVTFSVVAAAPSFTVSPLPETRFPGRPFTFTVAVAGSTPMLLQWKSNNVAIPGANSATYTDIASPGLNGVLFKCTASNEVTQVDSQAAALTVYPVPAPTSYAAAITGDSPLSYYRMDDTGSICHDSWSGNDGNYFGSVVQGQPGYSALDADTAAAFSGANNAYVGNISGSAINFPGHATFTIELWANGAPGQVDESTLIVKGIGATGTTPTEQFGIDVTGGVYRFFSRVPNSTAFAEADATDGPNGTWQYIVGVYNDTGDGGSISIYINGILQGTSTGISGGLRNSTDPVIFGNKRTSNDPNYNGGFQGTLDEIAIYPTALSLSQISAHYSAAYGPSTKPTISLEPENVTNFVSLVAKFSVGAFGTTPLTFQWKKGTTPLTDDGVHIIGSATADLSINNLVPTDADSYQVFINNSVGPLTSSIPATLTVLTAPTSTPSIPGLVLHLPFDGNLTDVTGRGNNGTGMAQTATSTNTAAPTYVAGKLGQALSYSSSMGPPASGGATMTNTTYVTLGVRPDLQFGSNVNFTVAFWIQLPANYTLGDLPFFTDVVGSTFGLGYVFAPSYGPDGTAATSATEGTNPGGWGFSIFDGAGNGVGYYGTIGDINDGSWHHLVHVVDRKNGFTTYLDGIPVFGRKQAGTSVAGAADIDSSPPNAATIGQDPTGHYAETGSANIDDLGVWRRALTPVEATSIFVAASVNGLSFTGTSTLPDITITPTPAGKITLTWPYGTLQSSTNVTGPYVDVPGATASPYTATASGTTFYRTRL